MERIPLYVDDMGETVFTDDLRAGLFLIRLRAKQGIRSENKNNRLKNKKALREDQAADKTAQFHTGIHRKAARALARFIDHRDRILKIASQRRKVLGWLVEGGL